MQLKIKMFCSDNIHHLETSINNWLVSIKPEQFVSKEHIVSATGFHYVTILYKF